MTLAHSDKQTYALSLALTALVLSGCRKDAPECARQEAKERAFVASHNGCKVDADCVSVGDCGNTDFIAVSASSKEQAEEIILARCNPQSDGPGYYAQCRNSVCERVLSTLWCIGGSGREYVCPQGSAYQVLGCGGEAKQSGCMVTCDPQAAQPCAGGHTCQEKVVSACPHGVDAGTFEEQAACDTCGPSAHFCLPPPSCQLELRVTLDWHAVAELQHDMGADMRLSVINRTDAPLTFSYDAPCHGLKVSGLADLVLWEACLAGACEHETERVTLTLDPGETRELASDLVAAGPSTCNPQGLADGVYHPSFTLENLTGATACGPALTELKVLPGSSSSF